MSNMLLLGTVFVAFAATSADSTTSYFQGCVDYEVKFEPHQTDDAGMQRKIQFLLGEADRIYGDRKRVCYDSIGNMMIVYPRSEFLEKIVYEAASNTEFVFFANGQVSATVNAKEEAQEFDYAVLSIEKTDYRGSMLGQELLEFKVVTTQAETKYWVADELFIHPNYFKENFAAEIYKTIKRIPLRMYEFGSAYDTLEVATEISNEDPGDLLSASK